MEVYGWGNHRTKWWVFHCHIWWPESIQGWFSTPITAGLMSVIPNCGGKQTNWLVVSTPMKNMKVSWGVFFPIWWESHSKFHGSSHHQPANISGGYHPAAIWEFHSPRIRPSAAGASLGCWRPGAYPMVGWSTNGGFSTSIWVSLQ